MGYSLGVQEWFNICKPINMIYINSMKDKILYNYLNRQSDKIQHPFMFKTLNKLGIMGTHLKIIQAIYNKHAINIMLCYAKSLQSCLTLCDPMDCSLPGFSVHGILQARTLEWVAISFSNA